MSHSDPVREPLTGPELAGAAAIFAATLIMIATARVLSPHPHAGRHLACTSQDLNTINGRQVCKASGFNTSLGNKP